MQSRLASCLQATIGELCAVAPSAGQPPTRSGSNGPAAQDSLLTEQTLQKQIKAAKDDPVLTKILEKALSALTTSKQQALPLKDQRAKLMAKQLAEKVDKQTKVIEKAVGETSGLQRGVGYGHPDTVPVPKPSPATYLAFSSALEQLLECASRSGDPRWTKKGRPQPPRKCQKYRHFLCSHSKTQPPTFPTLSWQPSRGTENALQVQEAVRWRRNKAAWRGCVR
eukprot:4106859-Amphidinium_carterae.1